MKTNPAAGRREESLPTAPAGSEYRPQAEPMFSAPETSSSVDPTILYSERRIRRIRRTAAWSGAVSAVLAFTAVVLPTPYIVESPGPTFNTVGEIAEQPVITVDGAPTFATEGRLDLTTVLVAGPPTSSTAALDVIRSAFSDAHSVIPSELVYPSGVTSEQVTEQNSVAMATSQSWAVAAALEELNMEYRQELFVSGFTPESQAQDLLQPSDHVLTANGNDITGLEGLKKVLNASEGQPVSLGIERDGQHLTVEVPVYPGPDETWLVGIYLDSDFDFPFDVAISLDDVGGPSAGMMFALGIIDLLTPGALTQGAHVAGTGTIDPDGTVGAIGGIVQKVHGAAQAGADIFLAPKANCEELAGAVPSSLTVYAVENISEARSLVETTGKGEAPANQQTCG